MGVVGIVAEEVGDAEMDGELSSGHVISGG